MAYGTVKVDNITFDNGGSDQNVTVSGLYRATTSGVTVTGTISGAVLVGTTTVSGATVTGNVVQGTTVQGVSGTFTSLTGTTTTGTTANFVSGVFTTQVSGTTVTGTTSNFTSGNFATLSGATATFTSGIIASGTAAAPSLAILADLDTGLFSPGANQVAVATNGTQRLLIDSGGRLLVGTSTSTDYYGGTAKSYITDQGGANLPLALETFRDDEAGAYLILGHSRSGTAGNYTILQPDDGLGLISFNGSDGTDLVSVGATIKAEVDGTPGADDMPGRLVFSTAADGASSPTERMRISNDGKIFFNVGVYNTTTALAANMHLDAAPYGIYRSTSSIKYKTDVEDIDNAYADAILGCRPVWYRSLCERDPKDHSYWGFIAEEVAQIDPRLVFWKTSDTLVNQDGTTETIELDEPEAENVAYDRFVPLLLNLIKRQKEQIETQGAAIAALETRLSAYGLQKE
jgi:hypothetical protein